MPFEEALEEIKKHISFKEDTFVGDIVLVGTPAGVAYAFIHTITQDIKKNWYNVTFSLLVMPPLELTWTLRQEQMSGEIFTINGEEHFMVAVNFANNPFKSNASNGNDRADMRQSGKVLQLKPKK